MIGKASVRGVLISEVADHLVGESLCLGSFRLLLGGVPELGGHLELVDGGQDLVDPDALLMVLDKIDAWRHLLIRRMAILGLVTSPSLLAVLAIRCGCVGWLLLFTHWVRK